MVISSGKTTPFVILALARTGSNLLASSLRSNPEVLCYGELFNNALPEKILWEYPRRFDWYAKRLRNKSTSRFLSKYVYRESQAKAVGFKLFTYHGHYMWQDIWDVMESVEGLRVIHLKRENLLRQYLSTVIAEATSEWVKKTDQQITVKLDPGETIKYFQQIRDWEHMRDDRLQANARLDISYEQLRNQYNETMAKVQDFLGVNHRKTRPTTSKQSRGLSDSIENYGELATALAGTEWERFLTNP